MLCEVLYGFLCLVSLASTAIIRRDDPPFQSIPATAKPDNTFNAGTFQLTGEPDVSTDIPPAVYGARSIDLPFGRLYHGNMKFFGKGQLNTPDGIEDVYKPGVNDFANQSACGIPDNAFLASKVAIHPYFLKYADLSRYCMQDVCISFWKEDGTSDMILKVTDICSTDPNDPTHCATPSDIKIERTKAQVMEGLAGKPSFSVPKVAGDQFPDKTWWFFTKCWADALAQPAYQGSANNWFTTPPLANNLAWSQATLTQQYKNNQVAYAAKGWPTYPNGAYNPQRDSTTSPPITDWVPGQEPAWSPIAGGKGWGNPSGGGTAAQSELVVPAQGLPDQPIPSLTSQPSSSIHVTSSTSSISSEASTSTSSISSEALTSTSSISSEASTSTSSISSEALTSTSSISSEASTSTSSISSEASTSSRLLATPSVTPFLNSTGPISFEPIHNKQPDKLIGHVEPAYIHKPDKLIGHVEPVSSTPTYQTENPGSTSVADAPNPSATGSGEEAEDDDTCEA